MVGNSLVLWLLTATSLTSLAVGLAVLLSKRASESSRTKKSPTQPPPTTTGDARLAQIESDVAVLFSELSKANNTLKRINSRSVMQERRDAAASTASQPAAPPVGASKAELRKFYGVHGMSGPEQARHQLKLVPNNHEEP